MHGLKKQGHACDGTYLQLRGAPFLQGTGAQSISLLKNCSQSFSSPQ